MSDPANRLQRIRSSIEDACRIAGRDSRDVKLLAVSKGRPATEIGGLIAAGQTEFGESRVQETILKWPDLLARESRLHLHCIGRLQSNKAADAVRLFSVIHSVDRRSLLQALSSEAEKANRFPQIYVQVNIGEEEQKGGCALADVGELVAAARDSPLGLAGLMAIPPAGVEPAPYFALLAKLARRHNVDGLSMGMSQDFTSAIKLGATVVRVGTALFEE